MQDARPVSLSEPLADLRGDVHRLVKRQRPPFDPLLERLALVMPRMRAASAPSAMRTPTGREFTESDMVLDQVGRMTLIGGAVGLVAALGLERFARSLLFEIDGIPPGLIVAVVLALGAVALSAGFQATMSLSAGSMLGPYAIRAELGHGGMGVVYTAHDPRLKRQVAIKLLTPDLTRDETAKQRFLQEAQAASALDHPNICPSTRLMRPPRGRYSSLWVTGSLELGRSGEVKCRQISEGWGVEEVANPLLY